MDQGEGFSSRVGDFPEDSPFNLVDNTDNLRTLYFMIIQVCFFVEINDSTPGEVVFSWLGSHRILPRCVGYGHA